MNTNSSYSCMYKLHIGNERCYLPNDSSASATLSSLWQLIKTGDVLYLIYEYNVRLAMFCNIAIFI